MHARATTRFSRLSHVPFSRRLFVAGAPAVSKDYAARCIRFPAYMRDATMYYIQRDAAWRRRQRCTVTVGTTGAATSLRRMCAAWCCNAHYDFAHREHKNEWNGMRCPSCLLHRIAIEDIGWLNLYPEKRKGRKSEIIDWHYMPIASLPVDIIIVYN